jgi:riboflavin biosynthesis pyrimidine reductase
MASDTTVRADTMTMGLPVESLREDRVSRGQEAFPLRVIWTRSGKIPADLKFFQKPGAPIVIFAGSAMPPKIRTELERYATVWQASSGAPSPEWALATLAQEHGVKRVVLEGGGTLFRLFLASHCIDELCLTWSPRIFGGQTGITLTGVPGEYLPNSVNALLLRMEQNGTECFTRWRLRYTRNFSGKH